MSNLLKHWNTSQSTLKSISSKPFKVTTRDALVITLLTLVATLVCLLIYYVVLRTPDKDRDYKSVAIQTVLTTLACSYLYEYVGINNMLAESSMRYAKGGTLAKYVSRREALLYECWYKLLADAYYKSKEAEMKPQFDILQIMLTEPDLIGRIIDYNNTVGDANRSRMLADINAKFPKAKNISVILGLPSATINAMSEISDHMNENIAYDILVNGWDGYELTDGTFAIVFNPLKPAILEIAEARGEAIAISLK